MQRERDKKVRGYSIEISAFSKGKTTLDQLITNLLIIMKTTFFFLMAIISIRVKPASTELQWRDLNARSCIQSAKNNPKNKQKQPTPKNSRKKKKNNKPSSHPVARIQVKTLPPSNLIAKYHFTHYKTSLALQHLDSTPHPRCEL